MSPAAPSEAAPRDADSVIAGPLAAVARKLIERSTAPDMETTDDQT